MSIRLTKFAVALLATASFALAEQVENSEVETILMQLLSSSNPGSPSSHPYIGHHTPTRSNYAHFDEHQLGHDNPHYEQEYSERHYVESEPYHFTHASHPKPHAEHPAEPHDEYPRHLYDP